MTINGQQAIKVPDKSEQAKFQNYHRQLQAPFVYTLILKQLPKKFNHVNQMIMIHIRKFIKNTPTVHCRLLL